MIINYTVPNYILIILITDNAALMIKTKKKLLLYWRLISYLVHRHIIIIIGRFGRLGRLPIDLKRLDCRRRRHDSTLRFDLKNLSNLIYTLATITTEQTIEKTSNHHFRYICCDGQFRLFCAEDLILILVLILLLLNNEWIRK